MKELTREDVEYYTKAALNNISTWTQESQDKAERMGVGIALWRGCVATADMALKEIHG